MPTEVQIYKDGTIVAADIANLAITTAKIANGNVTTAKLDSSIAGALVPIGGIIMWSGSVATIPSSWRLCNGQNGTPNLQDRFVVGAGSGYAVGATGGSANATLVSHSHTATSTVTDLGHSHTLNYTVPLRVAGGDVDRGVFASLFSADNEVTPTTDLKSSGVTVSTSISTEGATPTTNTANLPPYYALAFIMRVS